MNKKTRALTEEQYRKIITTINEGFVTAAGERVKPNSRIATALTLEANLGLRISDILHLTINQIVKDGDRYRLDLVEQKTGKKREFTVPNFHDNNPEKAYEFYKERMPNVCVEIMSEKISEEEFQKQYEFSESSKKIAYSGRAKSLNCNFYCDSGHHKIVYTADDNKEIKCPLIMHYDGNISISAYCSRCHWNENVVGNVFDGKSLREMITEWNYRTPLTCDEACELEEFRMLNDLKEKSERRDFYSKIGGTELSEEKIEKATFGKEFEIFYLENYRLKLHERVPALTTDEIENISIYALDLVRSKKEMSEEEYKNAEREMDIEISRMAFEHLYDDIKEVHERLPYLTPEECQEWFDCWKRWSAFQDNKLWNILTFDYVMRGWKLEELNDQREKNMSSLFDYIVLGNQEGKIKDGSE